VKKRRSMPPAAAAAVLLAVLQATVSLSSAGPGRPFSVALGQSLRGTVSSVIDGDTIRVRLAGGVSETVRLIGVDSQELDDAREGVRFMAFQAKRFVFGRLYQKTVELVPGPEARDQYGRLLAFVRMGDGEIFNLTLVREGYALAYLKFPFDESLRKELRAAEAEARRAGRGLWVREPYPVIAASEAAARPGVILTVRFRCRRSFRRGGFRLLEADEEAFDAAIPLDVFRSLPGSLDFEGRRLEATGLIELYKGRPQIVIGVPLQLKRID
jgi:micrococcal nuclease